MSSKTVISLHGIHGRRACLGPIGVAMALLLLAGCGRSGKVSDAPLQPIQEMLDASLPPGTPGSVVNQFVSTRGYTVEPSGKADALVVVIRHIDREKLQPVTARVTFHFDANDKLVSTDIVRTLNQPQAQPQTESPAQPSPQPQ